jgi:hypothetical protein
MSAARRAALNACRKCLSTQLTPMIYTIRNRLVNGLGEIGRTSRGLTAHAAQAEAKRVEARAIVIARDIEVTMVQGFAEISDLDRTQELTVMLVRAAASGQPIGSADAAAAEPSTRSGQEYLGALCKAAESRYDNAFRRFDRRLATIVGHRIDDARNPLLPATICRIFWRAVLDQVESPRVEKLLYEVVLREVIPWLGELYGALTAALDACEEAAPPGD